jgi:tetratricopeptide (TPR) repeat protein
MRSHIFCIPVCLIFISFSSHLPLFSQNFQVEEVCDQVYTISEPDLGSQVVVQSARGLVIFDSFWSAKTAGLFKKEISKIFKEEPISYVVNMVDRLDMIGGNGMYPEAIIIGHRNIPARYKDQTVVDEELADLVEMWREKEGYSRDRLVKLEAGTSEAREEENWMNKCISMADELESSFSLFLPAITYSDRMTLDLGDLSLDLVWLGRAGKYRGLTMAVIPELELGIASKAFLYPDLHLAPYPFPYYGDLDVPRWIAVLDEAFEGEAHVSRFMLSDDTHVYPAEVIHSHLDYIRELWKRVRTMDAEGRTLQEIQSRLSLDSEFAFVKEMQPYKNTGDFWIRPQHEMHVRSYYLQGRNLASEIIRKGGFSSLQASLKEIGKLGEQVYFDEISMDFLGSEWMNKGRVAEAIEVFKLNLEAFPESSGAFTSLGTAYLNNGEEELAASCFRKSIDMDPDNERAVHLLQELEGSKL